MSKKRPIKKYQVFKRRWWKDNPDWPNGLEPSTNSRKTHLAYFNTEDEAREYAQEYNRVNDAGRYSLKAEFRQIIK